MDLNLNVICISVKGNIDPLKTNPNGSVYNENKVGPKVDP